MASVNPPRGMRDFLPAEKARREAVLGVIRERYRAHGFDEIETPVMEDYERLHAGIGGDNEKLAYNVLRRGLDADAIREAADDPAALADLGLRYDLTVPLARFYASHRADLPAVFRSIQAAPVWRAERPQKGRYRQFVQCDIDIIGDASTRAESELIVATLDAVDSLGLKDASVRINDRRILDWLLGFFGVEPDSRESVLITLDKLDKKGRGGVVEELYDNGVDREVVSRIDVYLRELLTDADGIERSSASIPVTESSILSALPTATQQPPIDTVVEIAAAIAGARGANQQPLVFDPFLVRGMGYYTGTIFELAHPSVTYSLGGGGRYDGMIGRFLGTDIPAVGFSIGFERLVDLLDTDDTDADASVVLVHDADVEIGALLALKSELVSEGLRVRLELRPKNLKPLLERASADGFASFATVGAGGTRESLVLKPLA